MDFLHKDAYCLTCGSSRQPLVSLHTIMPCESGRHPKTHWQCLLEVFCNFQLHSGVSQSTCERCTKTIRCAYLMHKLLLEPKMAEDTSQSGRPSREMVTVTVSVAMNGEQRGGGGMQDAYGCDDQEADRRFSEFFGSTLDMIKLVNCHEVCAAKPTSADVPEVVETVSEVNWPPASVEQQNKSQVRFFKKQVEDMDNLIVLDPDTYHVTYGNNFKVSVVVVDPNNNQLDDSNFIDDSAIVDVDTNLIVVDPNSIHEGYGVNVTRPMLGKEVNANQNAAKENLSTNTPPIQTWQYIETTSKEPVSNGEETTVFNANQNAVKENLSKYTPPIQTWRYVIPTPKDGENFEEASKYLDYSPMQTWEYMDTDSCEPRIDGENAEQTTGFNVNQNAVQENLCEKISPPMQTWRFVETTSKYGESAAQTTGFNAYQNAVKENFSAYTPPMQTWRYVETTTKEPLSNGEKSEQTKPAAGNPANPIDHNDPTNKQEITESQCIRYDPTFKCSICLHQKASKGQMLMHLICHHAVQQNSEKYYSVIFKCPDCPKWFNARRFLGTHYTLMHGSGKGSKRISNEIYICEYCDKEFRFKTGLTVHKRSCRRQEPINCSSCGASFKTLHMFEEHLRTQHGVQVLHECEICRKLYRTREYLNKHRKRHMERHHECPDCGMTYIAKSELKRHNCPVQGGKIADKFFCSKCQVRFKTPQELKEHQTLTHKHKCKTCGQEFETQYRLRKHCFEHTGRPYHCAQCDIWFERRPKMQLHAKLVHQVSMTIQELNDMHLRNMGRPHRCQTLANKDLMLLHSTEEELLLEEEMQSIGININDMGDIF